MNFSATASARSRWRSASSGHRAARASWARAGARAAVPCPPPPSLCTPTTVCRVLVNAGHGRACPAPACRVQPGFASRSRAGETFRLLRGTALAWPLERQTTAPADRDAAGRGRQRRGRQLVSLEVRRRGPGRGPERDHTEQGLRSGPPGRPGPGLRPGARAAREHPGLPGPDLPAVPDHQLSPHQPAGPWRGPRRPRAQQRQLDRGAGDGDPADGHPPGRAEPPAGGGPYLQRVPAGRHRGGLRHQPAGDRHPPADRDPRPAARCGGGTWRGPAGARRGDHGRGRGGRARRRRPRRPAR